MLRVKPPIRLTVERHSGPGEGTAASLEGYGREHALPPQQCQDPSPPPPALAAKLDAGKFTSANVGSKVTELKAAVGVKCWADIRKDFLAKEVPAEDPLYDLVKPAVEINAAKALLCVHEGRHLSTIMLKAADLAPAAAAKEEKEEKEPRSGHPW
mmetsp:Transcript_34345/g.45220  ORF Transcript_34345/g.45220 Transcript_34345/m.45220 type:complete len:155 (-) Transcript_34345:92-556(-)